MRKTSWALGLGLAALIAGSATATAQTVVLGGNPPGSLFYSMAQAIATTVSKHSDLRVDVLPQGGSTYYPMMATQEVDFGLVNPMDALDAALGAPPFDKASRGQGFPIQTLMLGSPIRLSMVTTVESGITSLQDLKGRRVVSNYGAFASAGVTARAALANAGLTEDDVQVVTVSSYPEGVRAVMEGRAVAAVGSIGSGIIQELDAARGARILPIDPSDEAMNRAREHGAAYVSLRVPKGLPGVREDIDALSYAITVVVRSDLDEETAYTFLKTVWENHKELPKIFRGLATWTPDRFASTQAVMPYHPGAIRFFREQGVWTDEMEKHQTMLQERMKKRG